MGWRTRRTILPVPLSRPPPTLRARSHRPDHGTKMTTRFDWSGGAEEFGATGRWRLSDPSTTSFRDCHHGRPGRDAVPEVGPTRRWVLEARGRSLVCLSGVLNGQEERLVIRREERAAHLCARRNPEEVLGRAAPFAVRLHGPQPVRPAGHFDAVAVRGDPEPTLVVDRAVVRHPKPAIPTGLRGKGCAYGRN